MILNSIKIHREHKHKYVPEVHSLWRSDFDAGPDKENAIGRKSDDIVEEPLLNIDDLQNVTGLGAKQVCFLYDEELLFLRGPQKSPRSRKRSPGGDSIAAQSSQGIYGLDNGFSFLRVPLGLEASILIGYEVEEFLLGQFRLGCVGQAGDLRGARVVITRATVLRFEPSIGKEDICGHGVGAY